MGSHQRTLYVIEAKSGAKDDHPVYKSSAEQLSNAMDWFTAEYTTVATGVPVLIHPRAQFERKAAVPSGCRVVTTGRLTLLRDALRKLAAGLADDDALRDPDRTGRLLAAHRLTASDFLDAYPFAQFQASRRAGARVSQRGPCRAASTGMAWVPGGA